MAGTYEREFEEEETGRLEKSRRGYWANKAEFILACFGNVWGAGAFMRFPYLCFRWGGLPVFMIAYIILLVAIGVPMILLEMTIGQYASQGVLSVYRMCPLFKGVGFSILLSGCFCLCYQVQYLSWPIYYLYVSFTSAWMNCDNHWNTNSCQVAKNMPDYGFMNLSYIGHSEIAYDGDTYNSQVYPKAPTEEYFNRFFLQWADGSGDFGISESVWKRILCLAVCWIVIAISLCLGVRSLGKVVYFTSTVPILLLLAFMIRALTLPGAMDGMKYLFLPNFERLSEMNIWTNAAAEVIYGLGLGYGGYLTLASYNRFRNFYVGDTIAIITAHLFVRIMSAVIVLGFAGFLSHQSNTGISELMTTGVEVIYTFIPEALAKLPAAPAWCFFFFLTVLLLHLGSIFPMMEMVSTAICDLWRPLLRLRFVLVGILSSAFFLVGILFCTSAGYQVFLALDLHLNPFYQLVICCAMTICAVAFYNIYKTGWDIYLMLGGRHICLLVIAGLILIPAALQLFFLPLTSIAYLVYSAINYMHPPSLPWWSQCVGFGTLGAILLPMLLWPIIMFISACISGSWGQIIRPEYKWGPHLSRYRVRATHLPHINVSPLTAEGVKLDRMAPIARYDN